LLADMGAACRAAPRHKREAAILAYR
jgi:hypothetical protein